MGTGRRKGSVNIFQNKRNRRRIFNGDAKGKTIAMAGAATGGRAFKDVMREKKKRLAETMNSKRKLAESSAQVDATKKREVEEVEEMVVEAWAHFHHTWRHDRNQQPHNSRTDLDKNVEVQTTRRHDGQMP